MTEHSEIQRPETVLFVGAGATASLNMPTTEQQAGILWRFCDKETLSASEIESAIKVPRSSAQIIADTLDAVNSGFDCSRALVVGSSVKGRAFPGISCGDLKTLLSRLRSHYDWGALQLVASAKKGGSTDEKPTDSYLQEVFTLFDVCIRDNRGFKVYHGEKEIFLSVTRLNAARETLVLLINTLFVCAWRELIGSREGKKKFEKYRAFFYRLAKMMQQEGRHFYSDGCRPNYPEFYQFSYAVITTNFEPLFL